jgi:hypothetical protein
MKLPVSWLKDFVDLDGLEVVEIARLLTMAGMEVEGITFVGLPLPAREDHGFKVSGRPGTARRLWWLKSAP